ncbi:CpsB/CapC family capsule biosynthesis tyrosine phosphatase [Priestia megaterium]|uniref:CpsB/CapC family capsule biosynthesis tyrosine phosphatase n=1 Tax=Priestia megaterium TaxID=1404 RepID=UPI0013E2FDB5|nr:CpsB/CapC family capsule biosynthesis tyrosine phosphatase [Priestia megaterium]MED3865127.1 tyrosine protein phosphatase [Priestia megaterium]MED4099317.1 tyrosine protein phosphatase [Priestia megaterium]MED4144473.1 tyrosine protein phosphatase [Priestia megaterium]MED4165772.1 tyrosine protein phosphatase [Priestia megaterium]MED4200500.1 tyrosine protein phosphatase [Priestia megaterium]
MIDIYTRMLPRTASSKQQFVDAAKHLASQGIKAVAATLNDKETNTSLYVKEANQTLKDNNIPLTIVEGTEVVADRTFAESYQRRNAMLASNEKYIVLTIPKQEEGDYLKQLIYDIQLNKIVPIISEPECHPYFLKHKSALYKFVKKGAIVQLSSDSIIGKNGKHAKKAAMQFIERNLAHVIASGASLDNYKEHSLRQAYDVVTKEKGAETAQLLMQNAEAAFNGQGIHMLPPERIKKTKFLGIF